MFTQCRKWRFILVFSGLLAAMCLLSTLSHGQDEGDSQLSPPAIQSDTSSPPVAQTLLPEGVFAMQLAEALKLGSVPDEAKAEELLSSLGIEPKNGWLAEYPVTPDVLGDVEKGISVASGQGKIKLTKDQALKLVDEVKAKLGFDVNPGSTAPPGLITKPGNTTIYSYTDREGVIHFTDDYDSIPKDYQKNAKIVTQSTPHELSGGDGGTATEAPGPQYIANQNPEDINNYYYEQGPPLVTYYTPPDPYSYLYSWVPYPFWSTGFYFPGFFVLNNFHRQVVFNRQPFFVTHHVGGGSFSHPLSVGPVNRAWPGHMVSNGMAPPRWFSTPNAQASARAIVTLNQNRSRSINGTAVSQMNASRPSFSSRGNSRNLGNAPAVLNSRMTMHNDTFQPAPHFGGRILNQPAFNQRTYAPVTPRFYSPPAFNAQRAYGGSSVGGFHNGGQFGGFHGGGNFMGHGGGGSFGGASRGGHR
jgi:hypothetical protein